MKKLNKKISKKYAKRKNPNLTKFTKPTINFVNKNNLEKGKWYHIFMKSDEDNPVQILRFLRYNKIKNQIIFAEEIFEVPEFIVEGKPINLIQYDKYHNREGVESEIKVSKNEIKQIIGTFDSNEEASLWLNEMLNNIY